jgi:N6-L-threonylcarbamoyladenine synthase
VETGRRLLSNVVASQVEIHARYGGIVPEVASRQHVLQILPVVEQALARAETSMERIDAVAVTHGPGLAGSLMVGVNVAKALAFSRALPLYGINHLEGHIYAAWLEGEAPDESPGFPLVCLVASGGHTDLILMEGHGRYRLLGRTRDDAAGESFDKAARILGLGYPGGPAIQRAAQDDEDTVTEQALPRAWMRGTLDFSFSGVKTALLHRARESGLDGRPSTEDGPLPAVVGRLATAFQESVVDVLVSKSMAAARETGARGILLGGGVTANTRLREEIRSASRTLPVLIPGPVLCVDNAAMIAACAYFHSKRKSGDAWELDVIPSLRLG